VTCAGCVENCKGVHGVTIKRATRIPEWGTRRDQRTAYIVGRDKRMSVGTGGQKVPTNSVCAIAESTLVIAQSLSTSYDEHAGVAVVGVP
jgi:hypothetical protein